jgi:hypothetical protein
MFRHTGATLLLRNGADIWIQHLTAGFNRGRDSLSAF